MKMETLYGQKHTGAVVGSIVIQYSRPKMEAILLPEKS